MRPGAYFLAMSVLLLVSGCASPVVTRVSSTGRGLAPPTQLAFGSPDDDAPAADAQTQAELDSALRARGYSIGAEAEYLIDFSLADRPASLRIATSKPDLPSSGVKKHRFLARCTARSHRLTLVVVDHKTGETAFRGAAEENHCKGSLEKSRAALIEALVADLKNPRGDHYQPRSGQN
jgi:hypothetical protein